MLGLVDTRPLFFFGDAEAAAHFSAAVERLRSLGGTPVTIDYRPFRETAELLYGGPWVAERYWAVQKLLKESPDALLPVTRQAPVEAFKKFRSVSDPGGLFYTRYLRDLLE